MDEPLFTSWAVSWRRHGRQYLIDTDSPEFAHVTAVRLEEQDADDVRVYEVEGTPPTAEESARIAATVRRRIQSDAVTKAMKEAAG